MADLAPPRSGGEGGTNAIGAVIADAIDNATAGRFFARTERSEMRDYVSDVAALHPSYGCVSTTSGAVSP